VNFKDQKAKRKYLIVQLTVQHTFCRNLSALLSFYQYCQESKFVTVQLRISQRSTLMFHATFAKQE